MIHDLETQLAREKRINAALIDRVERSTDLAGNAFSLFETAIALENRVRERTGDLEQALAQLAATNAALAKTQAEAEDSRRRLTDAIESTSEGIAIFDADDRLVMCNATYLGLWPSIADRIRPGMRFDEIIGLVAADGTTLGAMIAPDIWLSERLAQHAIASGSHVHALADGRWIQINEIRTSEGGIVGVYTDITEVKAEDARARAQELAERSVLLQATLDSIQAGIAVYDRERQLVAWNDPLRRALGLGADVRSAIGTHGQLAAHWCAREPAHGDCLTMTWPGEGEAEIVRQPTLRDGRTLEVRRRTMPGGGLVLSFTDISAERQAARALQEANDLLERRVAARTAEAEAARAAAEAANVSKTHFVAAASHDLLQPLNAARLFTAALADRRLAPGTRELVTQITSALDSVDALLEALLEISRLDAGAITPDLGEFPVAGLVRALEAEFLPFARERGLKLVAPESGHWVRSDQRLLRRILQNLVSNALRYTPAGEVRVAAMVAGDRLAITVSDTGPGIAPEHHEAIWEEFRRLDHDGPRGIGLGLSIVRRAAAMLGHEVVLRSAPGEGASFTVLVPLAAAQEATGDSARPRSGTATRRHILVIDHEPAVLAGMAALLGGWGCRVTTAADADAGRQLCGDTPPEIALVDYHLDGGSTGLDAITALHRAWPGLPAVIITADRTPGLRDAAAAAGLHLLNKPVKPAQLRALLSRL